MDLVEFELKNPLISSVDLAKMLGPDIKWNCYHFERPASFIGGKWVGYRGKDSRIVFIAADERVAIEAMSTIAYRKP